MVAGGTACAAHIADHIPLRDPLPHLHGGLALQVSIAGGIVGRVSAVIVGSGVCTVVDGYKVTVVIIPACLGHNAALRSLDRCAARSGKIHAKVGRCIGIIGAEGGRNCRVAFQRADKIQRGGQMQVRGGGVIVRNHRAGIGQGSIHKQLQVQVVAG